MAPDQIDPRFSYEPLLSAHPQTHDLATTFLDKQLQLPIWVSSMTGGTEMAKTINHNLARACHDFGMGMGLGSCRPLLGKDGIQTDFDVRAIIGDELPLYGNLGIAQIEELLATGQRDLLHKLVEDYALDGLIVHVNPLQEALQPEGDQLLQRPIDLIAQLLDEVSMKIIVKEVGQGMGKESLRALLTLPLAAIDFAASGGTNFALLETIRSNTQEKDGLAALARVGHTATQMVHWVNELVEELSDQVRCREVIISGGINDFLDGHYLTTKLELNCVYGQASAFLRHAMGDYETLRTFVLSQAQGLALARCYLKVR